MDQGLAAISRGALRRIFNGTISESEHPIVQVLQVKSIVRDPGKTVEMETNRDAGSSGKCPGKTQSSPQRFGELCPVHDCHTYDRSGLLFGPLTDIHRIQPLGFLGKVKEGCLGADDTIPAKHTEGEEDHGSFEL